MITRDREIQVPFIKASLKEQLDTPTKGIAPVASMVAAGIVLGAIASPLVSIPVSVPLFQTLSACSTSDSSSKRKRRPRPTTPEYLAAVSAEPINYLDFADAAELAIWDVTASDGLI
ncbi:hypothetical protein BH11CYA1_BH11CYA1_11580 [soil metagenome]